DFHVTGVQTCALPISPFSRQIWVRRVLPLDSPEPLYLPSPSAKRQRLVRSPDADELPGAASRVGTCLCGGLPQPEPALGGAVLERHGLRLLDLHRRARLLRLRARGRERRRPRRPVACPSLG